MVLNSDLVMKPPQALLFDLDSTLLDDRELQTAIVRTCSTIAAAKAGLDAVRLLEANREAWQAYWPGVEDEWALGFLDGATVSTEAWRRTLSACGCVDESLVTLAIEAHSRHARDAYRLYEDALNVLSRLKGRLPLGVITNGAADTQREKLRWLDIERHFGVIAISGEVGVAKPDAAIFRVALEQLAIAADSAWHVGDSLQTDVAGAKSAGLTAVWLNRHGIERKTGDPEPHFEIASLTELLALLEGTGLGRRARNRP